MNIIETQNLCKQYGRKKVVSNVNMHVQQGDIYGFIGRNGSGKSTTLKMLCGLAHPTEGTIRLFEQPSDDAYTRKRVGALIETAGLEPSESAYENMMLKALIMGIPDARDQVRSLLTLCGLNPDDRKKSKKFSMGMKCVLTAKSVFLSRLILRGSRRHSQLPASASGQSIRTSRIWRDIFLS